VLPGPQDVTVSLSLCEDAGTACHPVTVHGHVVVPKRKGRMVIEPVHAAPAAPTGSASGAVRILDFGAVWCPPCNLLNAEVLHDPADAGALAPYQVQPIDVDRPESWELKARYAVGGYPTLIAVDTAGLEVARLVGYPGEAQTLAWIAGLATVTPLHALEGEAKLTGADAAAAARRLADAGRDDDARRYLAAASDGVDLRIARLKLDGKEADAVWLLDAKAPAGDWIYDALNAAPNLWPRIVPLVPGLSPSEAADVLSMIADTIDPPAPATLPAASTAPAVATAKTTATASPTATGKSAANPKETPPPRDPDLAHLLRATAITLVRSTETGDPDHDRGDVVMLADLYDGMGQRDAALALLDQYSARYPGEFTFDFAAARLLADHGDWAAAEPRARTALQKAWGDQRLRAVQTLARALAGEGRKSDALAVIDDVLANTPQPAAEVAVRTHRYVAQVKALREEIAR
jgi:thiol-disulfide isomerase/thioredoxin